MRHLRISEYQPEKVDLDCLVLCLASSWHSVFYKPSHALRPTRAYAYTAVMRQAYRCTREPS